MRVKLDPSTQSVVAVCACGWRTITSDRLAAWTAARAHERRAHPGDDDTAAPLGMQTARKT